MSNKGAVKISGIPVPPGAKTFEEIMDESKVPRECIPDQEAYTQAYNERMTEHALKPAWLKDRKQYSVPFVYDDNPISEARYEARALGVLDNLTECMTLDRGDVVIDWEAMNMFITMTRKRIDTLLDIAEREFAEKL